MTNKIEFNKQLFLAPMAEITTSALRKVVREFDKNVILYSEMLSAGAMKNRSTFNRARIEKFDFDDPIIFQILGNDPFTMSQACKKLSDNNPFAIDINMGCSAPDIIKKKQGSSLLKDISSTAEIVRACRKATETKLSVKMRIGLEEFNEQYLHEFIGMLITEGVDFITIHGRIAKLSFKRLANWEIFKSIKENFQIPIIGNGDIISPEMAIQRLNNYSCNGVMIGREAIKSPWIFKLINDLMTDGHYNLKINILEIFISTLEEIGKKQPQMFHKSRGHRFAMYFSANVIFGHELFRRIRVVDKIPSMIKIINEYFKRNPEEKIKTVKSDFEEKLNENNKV